jgi:hypothetical protein
VAVRVGNPVVNYLPGTADDAEEVDINHAYYVDQSATEHLITYGVALPQSPRAARSASADAVVVSVEDKPVLQTYLELHVQKCQALLKLR